MNTEKSIKRLFFDVMRRGTGRACLIAQKHPDIDFTDEIVKGVLKNHAYDGQCETDRANYIWELTAFSKKPEKIRQAMLAGLATETSDPWTLTHLFALAKLYAQQGDCEAKKAIYDRFLNPSIMGLDWAGTEEILELDGINGLVAIAEKYGRFLKAHPEAWQDDALIRDFQENYPQVPVRNILDSAAKTNSYVRIYLEAISTTLADREKHTAAPQPVYTHILDEICHQKVLPFERYRNLSESELFTIAEALVNTPSTEESIRLLRVFTRRPFPLDASFVLRLAQTSKNSNIRHLARAALALLKGEKIREFALNRIPVARDPGPYIRLLISNYKEGDDVPLHRVTVKFQTEDIVESLLSAITDVYAANPTPACKKPLEVLYEKSNCGSCRHNLVRILTKNGVLPDKIREEIPYDSYPDTRNLLFVQG